MCRLGILRGDSRGWSSDAQHRAPTGCAWVESPAGPGVGLALPARLGRTDTREAGFNSTHELMSELTPVKRAEYVRLRRAVMVTGLFLIAVGVQGAGRPGYDAWQQSISALSLSDLGWVQDVCFTLLGGVLLTTVPTWSRVLRGGLGHRAYPVLTALTGLSLVAVGWWPTGPSSHAMTGRAWPANSGGGGPHSYSRKRSGTCVALPAPSRLVGSPSLRAAEQPRQVSLLVGN